MKQEEAIFRALFNTDDVFLSEAENPAVLCADTPRRLKIRWLSAAAVAILLLTVAVFGVLYPVWDELFIQQLHPDSVIIHKTETMVQDVQVSTQFSGTEIKLTQTFGDASVLYLALDIQFPTGFDFNRYIQKNEKGAASVQLMPRNIYLYKDCGTDANPMQPYPVSITVYSADADIQSGTVRFLLRLADTKCGLNTASLTLTIGEISLVGENCEYSTLLKGPISLTWKPENMGTIYTFELIRGKDKIGDVYISSLSMSVSILAKEIEGENQTDKLSMLYQSLEIRMKNGDLLPVRGNHTSSAGSMLTCTVIYDEVLDLEQVDAFFAADFMLKPE